MGRKYSKMPLREVKQYQKSFIKVLRSRGVARADIIKIISPGKATAENLLSEAYIEEHLETQNHEQA